MTDGRVASRLPVAAAPVPGLPIAVAVLVLMLLLAACGGSSRGGSGAPTPSSTTPSKGGTLKVAFEAEPAVLDPAIAWDTESWSIERLTYQTFLTYTRAPGEAGTTLVPDLATDVPSAANGGISRDGLVYTFHVRKGVKFAPPVDRELTAADFKYSFERMMAEPLAPATFFYTGIVGAQEFLNGETTEIRGFEVVGRRTVRITLTAPDGAFLQVMAMPFTSVLPREWVADVGKQITRRPLGTGPYVIDTWTPGKSITAVRNANWTGEADQWVDRMEFTFLGPGTALSRLESGDVDVLGDPIPMNDYLRTKEDPVWGKRVVDAPQIAWFYVFMNVLEPPFDETLVRRAVSYAVDTQKIAEQLGGRAVALDQIYPEGLPGHEVGAPFSTYDPEQARALLAAAGFATGFKTVLATHDVDPFPAIAKQVQSDLAAVGIEAEIQKMDRATYWNAIGLAGSHIAIGLSQWYMDYPDPSDWIGPLFTEPTDGGANSSFYEDPRVDALYEASQAEQDPAARIGLFRQMQDIIMRSAPTTPLYQPVWNGMSGATTGGFYIHPVWTFDFFEYWKTNDL